jgi:DMSO/TMAO reductase YedYZ molybdopterin-dependent catalytic subunit
MAGAVPHPRQRLDERNQIDDRLHEAEPYKIGTGTQVALQSNMPELPRAPSVSLDAPLIREIAPGALALPVTPAGEHFVRSHFATPKPPSELELGGAVAEPARLDLAALRSFAQRTQLVTLECAGNGRLSMAPLPAGEPWRRGAVSTALWTGVPLSSLLDRARLRDDVVEILVRGADRGTPAGAASELAYERALPVGLEALVALEMNGLPIPLEHGGPIRLVVPGWYGMASVKWVTAIEALVKPFAGWFQRQAYVYDDAPVTTMRVSSRIVAPADESRHPAGPLRAWGWAWSGDGRVASVSVSLDAGPWRPARVEPSSTASAWARWEITLEVSRPGHHSLRACAQDEAGNRQPEAPIWNRLGYGNNAVETIVFTVGA